MADTTPGSALVVPVSFGESNQSILVEFDRIRIRNVNWNYIDNTLLVTVDYGREDPILSPASEWFLKSQAHPIVNIAVADTVNLNGIVFSRLVGTHYTTLKALVVTGGLTVMENLEDAIFAAFIAIGYFPSGVET